MTIDMNALPGDSEQLQQLVRDLVAALQSKETEVEHLRHQLDWLRRAHFGRKSEKLDDRQLALFQEVLEQLGKKGVPAEALQSTVAAKPAGNGNGHGRQRLPERLSRKRIEYDVPAEKQVCRQCGGKMKKIGEEVAEQLEYVPASFVVKQHVRIKYSCPCCQESVVIAEKPAQPIEKGLPGPGLLAHIAVSKFADHLPLYRQESILKRHGIEIARSTLCDWIREMAALVEPIYDRMKQDVVKSKKIHTDDTPVLVQDDERGRCRQGRLWAYLGDDDHPHTVYDYTTDHSRAGPLEFLKDFGGYLQADAYAGYNSLYATGRVTEVGCWAHARRKYVEAEKSDTLRSAVVLGYISKLYEVERNALDSDVRTKLRAERSKPILEELKQYLDANVGAVLPKSPIGQAMAYTLTNWAALSRYADNGLLSIDNNPAERSMRHVVIGKKNWVFAGSDDGGRRAAILYSIIETCRRHQVEPFAYLADLLERIPTHPINRLDELLPHRWKAMRLSTP